MRPSTLPELIFTNCERFSDRPLFYLKKNGTYQPFSYRWFHDQILTLATALKSLGLKKGDRIAILSENRVEWPVTDMAIMSIGAITVPIYPTLTPQQIRDILGDCQANAVFVSSKTQLEKILSIRDQLPAIQYIVSYDSFTSESQPAVLSFSSLMESVKKPVHWEELKSELSPEMIASIVYTSGTTAEPKGVLLHHKGLVFDIISAESVLNLHESDIFLSFLPLSHLYERVAGHYCPMWKGAAIAYAESLETVKENILEIKPTVIVAVPRFYEKILLGIRNAILSSSWFSRSLGLFALDYGQHFLSDANRQKKFAHKLVYNLFNIIVYKKIRQKLGGNIRYLISGGAPLPTTVFYFFAALGYPIIEGYGLTETHLIVTLTPYGQNRPGSCGKPIPGIELKIAWDGEILVKGPTVMAGYYNKPEQTAEAIDPEGWFHTGDIGYLDQDQFLYITGRKKHIIITSGGKNIVPGPVEDALKTSPYIIDAVLIGNQRKFPMALILPDLERLHQFAQEHGIAFRHDQELLQHPLVTDLFYTELEKTQKDLARFEKAKHFILIDIIPTIENGLLTPSLKIKREKLEQLYLSRIEEIYAQYN